MKTKRNAVTLYNEKKGNEFHIRCENFEPCEMAFLGRIVEALAHEEDQAAVRGFMLEGKQGIIVSRFGGRVALLAPLDPPEQKKK